MSITTANDQKLETHHLITKIIRIISVPLLNNLPSAIIQKMMKSSSHDAATVVQRGGSTHALEVMYTRHHRHLLARGIFQGVADAFWHHAISQPKALRNRLKIVEKNLEEEIGRIFNRGKSLAGPKPITILNIGGGSSRAIIQSLVKLPKNQLARIKVVNIDKDPRAIDLGRALAERHNLASVFQWINDDARKINFHIPPQSADIAEMVGLLDYFSEEKGIEVMRQIHASLKVGGLFIVANVHPNSEVRFVVKTGWPVMYYRSAKNLADMLAKAGFTNEPGIILEPLGVHLIVAVEK